MDIHIQVGNFGTEGTFGYQVYNGIYNFQLHIHQFIELTLILRGETEITINGEKQIARAGQFILIFPFQVHGYRSECESELIIYTFSPSLISDFIKISDGKVGEKAVFDAESSTVNLFNDRLISEKDLSLYSVRACLYAMLSDFTKQVELVKSTSDNNLLSRMISYMYEHYKEQLSLEAVAKGIGYSANYLSHLITKSFKMNFCSLLGYIRVENAKLLLRETDFSVLEIALECGFTNERSFHRHFKSVTGLTPISYRSSQALKIIKRK